MNRIAVLGITVFFVLMMSVNANAVPFGPNITIPDNNYTQGNTGWYGSQEDQEVEPGMVTGQYWDLEGFFLNGTLLTMVGGYDFKNGRDGFSSGDIFLDINGDAEYGSFSGQKDGNHTVQDSFGYDYVLVLDFATSFFTAYKINETAYVSTSYYRQNHGSNPWRYVSNGVKITDSPLKFKYVTGLSDADTGFEGGSHNAVTVDLSFLNLHGATFISHFTMGCGNDNLMGQGQLPAPEPASLILLGCGLIGFAGMMRKKRTR